MLLKYYNDVTGGQNNGRIRVLFHNFQNICREFEGNLTIEMLLGNPKYLS